MEYLELDVNFSLDYQPTGNADVVDALLQNRRKALAGGLYTLDLPDFVLHLCAHLYKEATVMSWVEMGRDLSLYKFCDLYLLIHTFFNDGLCETLRTRVKAYGLEAEMLYALHGAKRLFEIRSEPLDRLIASIPPIATKRLNRVVDPLRHTQYQYAYDLDITEWIFCPNRKELLYEIGNV